MNILNTGNMKIKDLKEPYRSMALEEQVNQGNKPNEELELNELCHKGNFDWERSICGGFFWGHIKIVYPKITTKIKAKFPKLFPKDNVFLKFGEMENVIHTFNIIEEESEKELLKYITTEKKDLFLPKNIVEKKLGDYEFPANFNPNAFPIPDFNNQYIKPAQLEKDRIAFISHNEKKAQMVSFVMKNKTVIEELGLKIITTGSTGERLEESGINVFKKYKSGTLGGDIEIGSRVCEGKVAMVFFFIDPLSAHAHDTDIGALIRVCNVHNVPFALNLKTAELCLLGLLEEKRKN